MSLFRVWGAPRRMGILALAVALSGLAGVSPAQDFRGSVKGRVTDPSGAALPGVTVTATHAGTNVPSTAVTNEVGDYNLQFLAPGTYTITAEMSGFKKRSESNIEVRIGDKVELPIKLEIGQQTETVEVVSEAPLLETATASTGQVIDEKRIQLMPLSDGNPFVLARLAPGVSYVDSLQFSRPFDNNATSGLRVDGGVGRNEFTLDGTPNTVNHGGNAELGRVAFVPPSDAVQEFKVETATFDAQQGHSGGTNVNVTIKSGTNRFFGTAYAFRRDEKWESDTFFNKKLGREKAAKSYNRYGGTLGGPIQRDKTFFFVAYEGLQDEFPEPTTISVPTLAQRSGDFSNLLAQGIELYNPLSARLEGTTVVRDRFPGNIVPQALITQFGREIMNLFPEPNLPGDADGRNNYFTTNPRKDDFYSITTRVDHNFSPKDKLFVRYAKNSREETRNYLWEIDGFIPRGTGLRRMNDNAGADYVRTISDAMMLNARVGWTRFHEVNFRPHEGYDPSKLGFSGPALSAFGGAKYLPQIDLDQYQDIGDPLGADQYSDIYTVQATLTRVSGAHSMRMGIDLRSYRADVMNPNHQAGNYLFRPTFTSPRQSGTNPRLGGDLVMLLLGIPTGGTIDRNTGRVNETRYGGIFFQDDWRVSEKLTVNLGLRYDLESGMTEKLNRNVRGFDLESTSPLEAEAKTKYAASPIPQLPASSFRVIGGYAYASEGARNIWESDKNNIQPRVGFAYKLDDKTVVRGGAGVYYAPFVIGNINQVGFSQSTSVATTTNNGLTFETREGSGASVTVNPFKFGVAEPVGDSRGLLTNVGRDEDVRPVERENARAVRFMLGFQRELPAGIMFEANYVGNRSSDIETDYSINPIPREYLSTSDLRDQATIDFLERADFANPFFGNPLLLASDALKTTEKLSRGRLLRPYPHFSNLTGRFYDGSTSYNALQLRLDKRFRGGFTIMGAYTLSKFTDRTYRLNPTDVDYEERPHPDDSRHRITGSMIWELPFGKGATGLAKTLLAGWNVTSMFTLQTGRPINLEEQDRYYSGNLDDIKIDWDLDKFDPATSRVVGLFPTDNFYLPDMTTDTARRNDSRIRRSSHIRTFPSRLNSYRTQTRPILDASMVKDFALRGRMRLQLRVEVFNALNFVELNNPNFDPTSASFGSSNQQDNLPREVQIGLKFAF